MSYTIEFGEFHVKSDPLRREVWVSAHVDEIPDNAPYDSTGNGSKSNRTHPSHLGWLNFADRFGLYDVFCGEVPGLLNPHPGACALDPAHLILFEEALAKATMTYEEAAKMYESYLDIPDEDKRYRKELFPMFDTLRLNWLVYWTKWCLENCEYPTLANS